MKRPRYFQWLQGENAGTVSQLDYISIMDGEYFYNFKDGEVCNQRFISKMTNSVGAVKNMFMVEIASPSDPWIAEKIETGFFKDQSTQESVDVPPIEDITSAQGNGNNVQLEKSAVGTTKYRAPRYKGPMYELPSLDDYLKEDEEIIVSAKPKKPVEPVASDPVVTKQEPASQSLSIDSCPMNYVTPVYTQEPVLSFAPQNDENDPVRILAKTCKKRDTDIDLTVSIKLPNKSVYALAKEEFEGGGEKFINCLIEAIDISSIIDALRDGITTAYEDANSENEQ